MVISGTIPARSTTIEDRRQAMATGDDATAMAAAVSGTPKKPL